MRTETKKVRRLSDKQLLENIQSLIQETGENRARDGLGHTPQRFLRAFRFLSSGYGKDSTEIINRAVFDGPYSQMVIVPFRLRYRD